MVSLFLGYIKTTVYTLSIFKLQYLPLVVLFLYVLKMVLKRILHQNDYLIKLEQAAVWCGCSPIIWAYHQHLCVVMLDVALQVFNINLMRPLLQLVMFAALAIDNLHLNSHKELIKISKITKFGYEML